MLKSQNLFFLFYLLLGFLLNYIWEWLQCSPYFLHLASPPTLTSMVMATLGDLLMMAFVYFTAKIYSNPLIFNFRNFLKLETVAIFLSIAVEIFALKNNRWAYAERNILIPGLKVSIFPILQMMIIIPISLHLAIYLQPKIKKY